MSFEGEKFLYKKDPTFHTSPEVEHEQERKKRNEEKTSQKPAEKIADFLSVIEKTHLSHRDDPKVIERIKESYHNKYVINENDVPESYFENLKKLNREKGLGDTEITEQIKAELTETLISDQKKSLDLWIDYLTSPDSNSFPTWSKYWAFEGMRKLSTFDKKEHKFNKRSNDTVAPFPDLNREALAYVVDAIVKKAHNEVINTQDPEFQNLLQGANFGKLYAWAIEKVTPTEEHELIKTAGEWVKYDQGSDHMPLVTSIQGHGTGWCTAGETTAQTQLQGGDFYVYYSYDENGEPTIPRVAIRMEDNHIEEVRGVAADQNLDPYITDVVTEKMREFGPEGESYEKKSEDMRRLTEIEKKHKEKEELTDEDLLFLYEINEPIEGFGYKKDPRIKEILEERNLKDDLSKAFHCSPDQISTTEKEALLGNIKYHDGYLDLYSVTSAKGFTLPERITKSLNLSSLASAEGLTLPKYVGGDLYLSSLTSARGVTLPEYVGEHLSLVHLTSAEGLTLPKYVGKYLDLSSLTSVEGLTLPEHIGGEIYLFSLSQEEKDMLRKKYPQYADKI